MDQTEQKDDRGGSGDQEPPAFYHRSPPKSIPRPADISVNCATNPKLRKRGNYDADFEDADMNDLLG